KAMTANCGGCATANATCDKCKAQMAEEPDEDENGEDTDMDGDGKKTKNATTNAVVVTNSTTLEGAKKMTTEEYLKATNAPPEVVAAVNNSVRIVNERKSR